MADVRESVATRARAVIAPDAVPQAVPVLPLAPTTLPRAKTPVQPTPIVPAIPLDERSIVDAKPVDDSPIGASAEPTTESPEHVTDQASSPRVPRAGTVLGSGPVGRLPARIVADVAYDADVDADDEDSIDTAVGAEIGRDTAAIPELVSAEATVPEGAPEAALAAAAVVANLADEAEAPFERELRMSRERAAVVALERATTGGDADPAVAYPRAAPTDLPQQNDRSTDPLLAWSKTAEVQPPKRRRLRMALAAIVVAAASVLAGFGVQSWLQAQDRATRTTAATTMADPAPAAAGAEPVPAAEPAPVPVTAPEPAPGGVASVEPAEPSAAAPAAPAVSVESAPPVTPVAVAAEPAPAVAPVADPAPAVVPVAADPAPAVAPVAADPAPAAAPVVARSAVAKRSFAKSSLAKKAVAKKPVKRAVKRPTRKKACVDLSCL